MLSKQFVDKYNMELCILYGAKIKSPSTWRRLDCSETVRIIGTFLFQSSEPALETFKIMIQDPLNFVHPKEITPERTVVTVHSDHISIKLILKNKSTPNFENLGLNNPNCLYPGKYAIDEQMRTNKYVNYLMDKFLDSEYLDDVELRVEKISFF